MSKEQLDRAAGDRVMVFDHVSGAHWTWLMLSWVSDKEQRINAAGGVHEGDRADFGLTPKRDGVVSFRCLREQCEITKKDEKTFRLSKGQSKDLALDAELEVRFSE